jgi:serine/threonine-protein kinase
MSPTPSLGSDRNLIFGLLALQMDFITCEQLLDALGAWMLHKDTPLGQLLRERGVLNERRAALVEGLVAEHVAQHGSPQASLAALRVEANVRQDLDRLDDADVEASLAALAGPLPAAATPGTRDGVSVASPVVAAPTATAPVGVRYRRLREHAKGGLGEVFVALDEELQREVALKEIQELFADDPASQARFLREAEITGNLEHPGVVPVYGLGVYSDGRPFYAMRFIRGETMHDAIRRFHQADENPRRDPGERSLALRELLRRFVDVCNAVAYAHSRGIIHRDLKPANVMLGEYGESLVVDWGLAKVMDRPDGEKTTAERPVQLGSGSGSAATEMGQVVGTPAFMPPEQARGEVDQMDQRSDVFALGATLYCLLTGQPPYQRHGISLLAAAAECDFPPPRQIKPRVPAALAAVCLKAMSARPEDRYTSARALAEDVQRFLADEPVSAHREPLLERARRWGRHNRSVVSAGLVLLAAVVVGLSVGLWAVANEQARTAAALNRALEAEQEARTNLTQAEANLERAVKAEEKARTNLKQARANLKLAKKAVDECFNVARNHPLFQQPRMLEAKKLLLKKTLPFYKNFRSQRPDDRGLQWEEGDQWFRVGYIEQVLVQLKAARKAYEKALDLAAKLAQTHPEVPAYQNALATTHNSLGVLLQDQGKREEALKEFRQARDLQSKLVKARPEVPEYQQDLASTHNNRGLLLAELGQREQALTEYQQARDIRSQLVKDHPEVLEYQGDLARTHNNLGVLLRDLGKREQALTEYQQAHDIQRKLVKAHPDAPAYHVSRAGTCCNLGNLLRDSGKARESLEYYAKAVKWLQAVRQRQPEDAQARLFLRNSHWGRASALNVLGRHREAADDWGQAVRLETGPNRSFLRLKRADSRARAGDYRRSAAEADDLGSDLALPGATLYELACIQALNAASAGRDASRPLPERDKRSEEYARQAVALLKRSAATGFFRDPAKIAHLDKDEDLAALRDRDDYKPFRAGLKP